MKRPAFSKGHVRTGMIIEIVPTNGHGNGHVQGREGHVIKKARIDGTAKDPEGTERRDDEINSVGSHDAARTAAGDDGAMSSQDAREIKERDHERHELAR